MYCVNCGKTISSTDKFCGDCGREVRRLALNSADGELRVESPEPLTVPMPSQSPGLPVQTEAKTVYLIPNPLAILGLAAAALVLIGSFGPWISADAIFGIHVQKNGTEGDGMLTAGCAAVAILFMTLVLISRKRTAPSWLAAIAFLISLCIGIYDWQDVSSRIRDLPSDVTVQASVGWGLHAVTIGAACGLLLSIIQIAQHKDA